MSAPARRIRACLECGGILKSATISFGENLVPEDLDRVAARARVGRDVFLALGTSLGVYPAAGLPEIALRNGARLVDRERGGDAVRPRSPTPCVREPLGDGRCPHSWSAAV